MSDNPIVDVNTDDLDAFNDLFHGKASEAPPVDDGPQDDPEDADASLEDTQVEDQDGNVEPEDDGLADEGDSEEPETPEPKKTRAQERIEQLLEKERLARERADALEARLRKLEETGTEAPKPAVKEPDDKAPHWDDKNEDGSDKYPLGQFDPQFAEDHIKYSVAKQLEATRANQEAEAERRAAAEAQAQAQAAWQEKLEPARERYPDFQEKGEQLLETFVDVDPAYGNYLESVIMSLDNGPDVLYYLASNTAEAKNIVQMGPMGATIALGRIDSGFAGSKPKEVPVRQTKAPPPPPTNKGTNASLPEIPDDTEDLDAFEAKFFKKSRR